MTPSPPSSSAPLVAEARPYPFAFDHTSTALVIIDMQRDFIEPGGFGETLGNDVSRLTPAIAPISAVLEVARAIGMKVVHTREGHRPDLTDLHEAKRLRGQPTLEIGDLGPKGRILVRGEFGHDIIDQLVPLPGEAVLDKPGKGAFYQTDLELLLHRDNIKSLIVCGVTTEVCVHTTVREANDRGFNCVVIEDGTASYFPEFHAMALRMIAAQGGIFGWTASSDELIAALAPAVDALAAAPAPVAVPHAA